LNAVAGDCFFLLQRDDVCGILSKSAQVFLTII